METGALPVFQANHLEPGAAACGEPGAARTGAASARGALLVVLAGGAWWSLPLPAVREVLRPLPLTRLPNAPACLSGLGNLRGSVLPVLSLPALLADNGHAGRAMDATANNGGARIVVVQHEAGRFGLLVDKVAAGSASEARPIDLAALLSRWLPGEWSLPAPSRAAAATGMPGSIAPAPNGPGVAGAQHGLGVAVAEHGPGVAVATTQHRTLLGFRIGTMEFALPIEVVEAVSVINRPPSAVPGTDPVMLGVLPVRGRLLPVLSGAALLGLHRRGADGSEARAVLTRVAGMPAALAVDALTGILRIPVNAIEPVPPILFRGGGGEARIQGICRLDDGRRLVQLLHPDHLLDQNSMHGLRDAATHAAVDGEREMPNVTANNAGHESGPGERFLLFQLGAGRFGLPIDAVHEVVRHPGTLTRLPGAPAFIEGLMTLRGQVLPVVDQGRRFASGPRADEAARRRIIVAGTGGLRVGFAVDSASEVTRFAPGTVSAVPNVSPDISPGVAAGLASGPFPNRATFDRVVMPVEADGPVLLVDPAALLDGVQRDMLAAIAAGAAARTAADPGPDPGDETGSGTGRDVAAAARGAEAS